MAHEGSGFHVSQASSLPPLFPMTILPPQSQARAPPPGASSHTEVNPAEMADKTLPCAPGSFCRLSRRILATGYTRPEGGKGKEGPGEEEGGSAFCLIPSATATPPTREWHKKPWTITLCLGSMVVAVLCISHTEPTPPLPFPLPRPFPCFFRKRP